MERETDTSTEVETDNAHPSDADTPEIWDYYDPDEDQDTVEEQEEGIEDEAEAETEDEAEDTDEAEEEAEEQDDEDEQPKPGLVTLADGTQVSHDELVKGYLRQSDYTRKAQDVSNQREKITQDAERIERVSNAFVDFIAKNMPPEPDPALASTDPNKFTAQKARFDAALQQVHQLIQTADESKEVTKGFSEDDHKRLVEREWSKLTDALPNTATREGKDAFLKEILPVAEHVGFSEEDIKKRALDHRLFLMADLAKDGLKAREARAKAKRKVEKAPPAAPRKPGQSMKKANRNAEAMRKLSRSGSIHDAVAIDFD